MKQVLKSFLRHWKAQATEASHKLEESMSDRSVSSESVAELRGKAEALNMVVSALETFFTDYQVVKRPVSKSRHVRKLAHSPSSNNTANL